MDIIFQWGLNFITMIQQINTPLLDSFFRAMTSLGDESFYLIFFPSFFGVLTFILEYGSELSFYYPSMLMSA